MIASSQPLSDDTEYLDIFFKVIWNKKRFSRRCVKFQHLNLLRVGVEAEVAHRQIKRVLGEKLARYQKLHHLDALG